ncbi:MAG: TIGR02281 family clan AA aspartic protease [Gammaproteobacteria bacterium]|nr:TIGR02281 family clan AA aspartic protease [Rhodocyclaceae bacterium]MBU3909777.1 TIGR02281 family clan AA aspartic protease [Gammaproteobacteria bacterium]MBU3990661.1 TIGR02281 family clan AA aspartic protease [Gammaproteobacteria bacterium]MBU4005310.1 TIGR02281 family clan AA aspartic protease [Gammaproteobacteria bacterium]MBU4022488.1 TIGR02281 family clan AA aspartic protease [Gammaproteobacteria bacterium]
MALVQCCLALMLCAWSFGVMAADIALVGLMSGKALVVIDGGKRQTLAVGATTLEGVKLMTIESGAAVFEIDGRPRRVALGQSVVSTPGAERPATTLIADSRGHFVVPGSVNGVPMRFLVDTGATLVSLGAADARRARIDASKGTPGMTMTANGPARVWRVRLESVKLGGITLRDVEASVHEQDMPVVLLGMSFLNRMEIHRDGSAMTLTQRY